MTESARTHLDGYNQMDANHETRELLPYAARPQSKGSHPKNDQAKGRVLEDPGQMSALGARYALDFDFKSVPELCGRSELTMSKILN